MSILRSLFIAVLVMISMPAYAQTTQSVITTVTPVPPTASPTAMVDAPAAVATPTVSPSGIPMVSGGIGDDDLAHMKSLESQYNLKLLFTEHNGMYLANVHVQINDKAGNTVLTVIAKGPILMLTLPPGAYKITATESGETHDQDVNVSGKSLASYVIRFRTEDSQKSN